MKVGFLETTEPDGSLSKSSKRLMGSVAMGIGSIILLGLAIVSFFIVPADSDTIFQVGLTFLVVGASLLGLGTLFERVGK
jgi:hypothetical protein